MDEKNKLYFGDNLKILREYVPDASVGLIYLDPACAGRPPFNSQATYNVLFKEKTGEESAAQIMAFEDTAVAPLYERRRRRSQTGATVPSAAYKETVSSGPRVSGEPIIIAGA